MQVLKAKGAKNFKRFGVKIPVNLFKKIETITEEVKAKGFQIDFSEPCIEALERFIKQAEADLKEVGGEETAK